MDAEGAEKAQSYTEIFEYRTCFYPYEFCDVILDYTH